MQHRPLAYEPEHLASTGARFGGRMLDNLTMVAPLLVTAFIAFGVEEPAVTAVAGVLAVCGYFGLQGYLMHRYGRTLGKLALRTRVVRIDGGPVGFFRGFLLRDLLIFIAGATRILGLINGLMVFTATRRCGHDHILGTVVLDEAAVISLSEDDVEEIANVFG